MISTEQKVSISGKLQDYCNRYGSQSKASKSLKDISSATVSQVLSTKWDLVSDDMWRNIASQIGWSENVWVSVKTRDAKILEQLLLDSQKHAHVFAIKGDAGSGKTHSLRKYVESHPRAYLLQCNEYWNRKYFLAELLTAMGKDSGGLTVSEMMFEVVQALKKQNSPLIIMDEADKLTDQVLYFFITLYNQLEDHCGIILCATDHLEKRIKRGLKLNKKGYKEIFSRMGRNVIALKGVGSTDVHQVCVANGISDRAKIQEIFEECEGDLRRVKIRIHAHKMTITN